MSLLAIRRLNALPGVVAPSTLYIIKAPQGGFAEVYFTNADGSETRKLPTLTDIQALIAAAGGGGGGGSATQLETARLIAATGDASWQVSFDGSADVSAAITLSATGVAAGDYAVVTVDAKGRVLSGRALTAADIPNLDASKITTGTLDRDTTGNAATATKLATARLINGVSFDGSQDITISATDATARIAATEKGAANGVATLDANGKVPAGQLPSYVDDVVEFVNMAAFPATGETDKIYLDLATNGIYRWSGSVYVGIGNGGGVSDSALRLETPRNIAATGDVAFNVNFDGSTDVSGVATLAATGIAAGQYTKITVDAKGRAVAGTTLTAADIPALDHTTVSSAGSLDIGTAEW